MGTEQTAGSIGADPARRAGSGRHFFVGMAALLLTLNVVGFTPSFFLRARYGSDALPLLTHLHGMVFSMMPQSLARLGEFESIRLGPSSDAVYALGGLVLLLAAVVIHDLWARGRPHPAVLWGAPAIVAAIALAAVIVPATGFGLFIVELVY